MYCVLLVNFLTLVFWQVVQCILVDDSCSLMLQKNGTNSQRWTQEPTANQERTSHNPLFIILLYLTGWTNEHWVVILYKKWQGATRKFLNFPVGQCIPSNSCRINSTKSSAGRYVQYQDSHSTLRTKFPDLHSLCRKILPGHLRCNNYGFMLFLVGSIATVIYTCICTFNLEITKYIIKIQNNSSCFGPEIILQ